MGFIVCYSFSITRATLPPHFTQFPVKTRSPFSTSPLKSVIVVTLEQCEHHTLFISCFCMSGGIEAHKILALAVNSLLIKFLRNYHLLERIERPNANFSRATCAGRKSMSLIMLPLARELTPQTNRSDTENTIYEVLTSPSMLRNLGI